MDDWNGKLYKAIDKAVDGLVRAIRDAEIECTIPDSNEPVAMGFAEYAGVRVFESISSRNSTAEFFRGLNYLDIDIRISSDRLLGSGLYADVYSVSDIEVLKLKRGSRVGADDCGEKSVFDELKVLKGANGINGLFVKGLGLARVGYETGLVLERLYPLDLVKLDSATKETFCQRFEEQLKELHLGGVVHGDWLHTCMIKGDNVMVSAESYRNVVVTAIGIRLVDAGNSVLRASVSSEEFDEECAKDLIGYSGWKNSFLGHDGYRSRTRTKLFRK